MTKDVTSLFAEDNKAATNSKSVPNEATVLKQKIEAIVYSLNLIEEERGAMKDLIKDIASSHGIKPSVVSKVAKYKQDPEKYANDKEIHNAIQELFDKLL